MLLAQLCIVDFAFGSNALYPANAALQISQGLPDVRYGKWFQWSIKFQLCNLVLMTGLLLLGLAVGCGGGRNRAFEWDMDVRFT